MKKVILLNVWHDDNAGDSAIAQTCIEAAMRRWPDAKVEVRTMMSAHDPAYESWNRHLRRKYPDALFLPAFYPEPHSSGRHRVFSVATATLLALYLATGVVFGPRRSVRARITGAEAIILVGGSDLFEVRRPITSRFRLKRITEAALDAVMLDVPVYLWGHTLGPFESASGRRIATKLLASAKSVLVRDELSKQAALTLAPQGEIEVIPDFGFEVRPSRQLTKQCKEKWGRYIALVPRRHFFDGDGTRTDQLLDQLAGYAKQLLDAKEVDNVVLVAQVVGPSSIEDDRIVVRELANKIGDGRVHLVDGHAYGPSEFCAIYAGALGVVSVRLHGAILAMAGGTPALAIAYFTGKTSGVMEGLDLSDSWLEFDDCTSERLLSWWRLVSNDDDRTDTIAAKVKLARKQLEADVLNANQ